MYVWMCDSVYRTEFVQYVHERENVRALEKTEYPFNIHSRLPLSDLAVKIPFLSLLVFIAIMSQLSIAAAVKEKVYIYSKREKKKCCICIVCEIKICFRIKIYHHLFGGNNCEVSFL